MPPSTLRTPGAVAFTSARLLELPLHGLANMYCARIECEAHFVGAFDRQGQTGASVFRRGTGGVSFSVPARSMYLGLALSRPDALTPCTANQGINRMVRPLLKALTKARGKRAAYFGRDHVSIEKHNAAWVSMGHHVASGRMSFEAFVPDADEALVAQVVTAYQDAHPQIIRVDMESHEAEAIHTVDPPWKVTVDEAIGTLGVLQTAAGLRIGGELMVSTDRLEALNAAAPSMTHEDAAYLDALFAPPAMLFGIRNIASFLELARAIQAQA